MHILGLDLGSKTLGIAMSDSQGSLALMKETFRFEEDDYDAAFDHVLEYLKEYDIKTVVLGLPKHMNGAIGIRANISIQFKEALEEEAGVEVVLIDERLTTTMALRGMASLNTSAKKRKKNVDQMAAANILQTYLDMKKG